MKATVNSSVGFKETKPRIFFNIHMIYKILSRTMRFGITCFVCQELVLCQFLKDSEIYSKIIKIFRDAAKEKLSGMMDLIGYPRQVLNSTWLNQRFFNNFIHIYLFRGGGVILVAYWVP